MSQPYNLGDPIDEGEVKAAFETIFGHPLSAKVPVIKALNSMAQYRPLALDFAVNQQRGLAFDGELVE